MSDFGVKHRLSSVAFAQSNKRAELGVKSMKRLIRKNTNSDGSLTNDRFLEALMTYHNTPDRDTGLSPAQVVFDRKLRDFLPSPQTRYRPLPEWLMLREDREKKALAKQANMERLDQNCHVLSKLAVGDSVLVQNQVGNFPSRWDITGVVAETREHDQYVIKLDGSGRMTLRNRKFLKKITPYSMTKHFKSDDTPRIIPDTPSQSPPTPKPEPEPTPTTPPTSLQTTPPLTVPPPISPLRISSQASRAPERLEVTWGAKSYDQAVYTDPDSLWTTTDCTGVSRDSQTELN